MDAIDRKILTALQDDCTISLADLSGKVGLSQTPCWKRIQRLEANGVITRRVALVSPEKIGLGLTVFVQIEAGDHSGPWLQNFARVVGSMPEVMELYRMAGDVDYMLGAGGEGGIGLQRGRHLALARFGRLPASLASCSARRRRVRVVDGRWIVRFGMSISIVSPSRTRPIVPPSAASGETWPIDRPEVPPEKRPSVISAQALPRPFDFR
jgi:DNA-binding Lrp family transcriptional regulator